MSPLRLAIALYRSLIRLLVDQLFNGMPGTMHLSMLSIFANHIEQHNRNALSIFPDGKSPDRSNAHKQELTENGALLDRPKGFKPHRTAYSYIRNTITYQVYRCPCLYNKLHN